MSNIVLFDYIAQEEDELTIQEGQLFTLLQTFDDDWWLIEINGHSGLAPSNFLKMSSDLAEYSSFPKSKSEKMSRETLTKTASSTFQTPLANSRGISKKLSKAEFDSVENDYESKTELLRLRALRVDAANKIANLKNAVDSNENQHSSVQSEPELFEPIITPQLSVKAIAPAASESAPNRSYLHDKRLRHEIHLKEDEGLKSSSLQQVVLDPKSIQFISKIIQEKINQEFAQRDKKIIEKVTDLVNDALNSAAASPVSVNMVERPISSVSSTDNKQSKIPRFKLPKIAPPQNTETDKPPTSSRNPVSQQEIQSARLPRIPNKPKAPAGSKAPDSIPISISREGVQYPQCRSIVYPSNSDINLLSQQNSSYDQQAKLKIRSIFGYYGDSRRHGGAVRGKNVVWLSSQRIAFPSAAVVVILDLDTTIQSFFTGHTEDVTCVIANPKSSIVASSQVGNDSTICIWAHDSVVHGISVHVSQYPSLALPQGTRGVSSMAFSGDGKYLIATSIEDLRSVFVFDWATNNLIARARTGHAEPCEFLFNPYCVFPFLKNAMMKGAKISGDEELVTKPEGCYTVVSHSSKQLKFWTLKQVVEYSDDPKSSIRGNKGIITWKYVIEGAPAQTSKRSQQSIDYSSACCVPVNSSAKGLVLIGTSTGNIQIWKQLQEENSPGDFLASSISWLTRGKMIMMVSSAHDSAIVELDFRVVSDNRLLLSCDSEGILNVWTVSSFDDDRANPGNPLEHQNAIKLDESFARSAMIRDHGILIGTANNSIVMLTFDGEQGSLPVGGSRCTMKQLMKAHTGKVRRICVHPVEETIFATASSDKTIRLWEGSRRLFLGQIVLDQRPTAICFSSTGNQIAVATESGDLLILGSEKFSQLLEEPMIWDNEDVEKQFSLVEWTLVASKEISSSPPAPVKGGKQAAAPGVAAAKRHELTELRYSPSGDILAIGSKDSFIHLLAAWQGYRMMGICKGHTSQIRNIDFSADGQVIRSTDAAKELLHWDVSNGQRITNPSVYKDIIWKTSFCIYGWGLQGIFNRSSGSSDTDITCVARSPDSTLVAVAGTNTLQSSVKLFSYPCLADSCPSAHGGHTSPVSDLTFLTSAASRQPILVSAGGNDCSIIMWDITYGPL